MIPDAMPSFMINDLTARIADTAYLSQTTVPAAHVGSATLPSSDATHLASPRR